MNEIQLSIKVFIDPDLTKEVMKTRKVHYDIITGEPIAKGSEAYKLGCRIGRKLYPGYVAVATYQNLTTQHQELTL